MTSASATQSSARKLSEVARRVVVPPAATLTGWPDIERTCRKLGATFDRWQADAGRAMFSKTPDGKYAATVGGVGLSLPRQVGKTHLVGYAMFALCVNTPGLTVIWTSQHSRTTDETMLAMQGMAAREKVAPHVRTVTTGNGDECVHFHNGSRILFGAREQGFGRGIPGVDVLVFDEAQNLTDKALDAMLASMNTAPNGLFVCMGTPPTPEDVARGWDQVFTRMRKDAISGASDDIVWIECGADPDADPDDRKQWAKANPSYPHRTPATSMLRLKKKLRPGSWLREGLGIWDEVEEIRSAIDPFSWRDLAVPAPPATEGLRAYGVVFHRDGTSVSLSAALKHPHGVHVETIARRPLTEGTYWLVEFFTAERDGRPRHRDAAQIVVFGKAGSTGLANDLRQAGVAPRCLIIGTQDNAITAATMLREAVNRGEVTHLSDPEVLDASIQGTREHKVGQSGGWVLVPKSDEDDSTPAESAAMALWAAKTTKRRPGRRTKGMVMS